MAQQARTQRAVSGKAYQILPISDLTGGLDLRTAQTLMAPNRARSLLNFSLQEPGALAVRPGYVAFSTSSLGSSRAQGGERVYLNTALPSVNSTAFTLVAWNGNLYTLSDSGGWSAALLQNLSSTNQIHFAYDRDLVAAFDGSTGPWKSTNGSSWTKMGITAPASSATTDSTSAGSLSSATFEVGYTYKDRDLVVQSNGPTLLSSVTLGSTGAIRLVATNSTQPAVDAIVVYCRNVSAGETVRRKASSQAQSAGATSTIVITSSNWSQADEEPSDHDVPPVMSFSVVWKNRWWGRSATNKNRIHFTQLFQPQSWPALFYIDIPFDRGDEITAVRALGDTLIIFGTTKIFVIIGQTSLDFEVRPTLGAQDGALGPRCVTVVESGVVHIGANGGFLFDGASDRLLSNDIEPGWRDLVRNAAVSDLASIAVVYHQQRKEIRISVPRKYPLGTFGEWILDLQKTRQQEDNPAWTETDRTIGGYISWDGPEASAGNRGRLFSWHSSMARVFEESTGTSANSSDMHAEYEGAGMTLGTLRGRWVDLRGEFQPSSGSLAIEPLVDGVSMGSQNVTITGSFATYDTSTYDVATYAGVGRKMFHKNLPLAANGHTLVLKAAYQGQDEFKLFTVQPGLVNESRARAFNE